MTPITVEQTNEVLQKQAGLREWFAAQKALHEPRGKVFGLVEDTIKSQLKDEVRRAFPKTTESFLGLKDALAGLKYEALAARDLSGLSPRVKQLAFPPKPSPTWTYKTIDDRIAELEGLFS